MENILWYNKPPEEWMEGLPIGNGRLAAMVLGDTDCDVLSLNHEWLWRGVHRDRDNIVSADMLGKVRELLKTGDFFRATSMTNTAFAGLGGISGIPGRIDAFQPAGDLYFQIKDVVQYKKRELDIINAVANVQRETPLGEIKSCFIAHPEINNILCRWEGYFSGELFYSRVKDENAVENCTVCKNGISYECSFNGGISFKVDIRIKTDGKVHADNGRLIIDKATELTAYINIATEVKGIKVEIQSYLAPLDMDWNEIIDTHRKTFSESLGRFKLKIDLPENKAPTDERIGAVRQGGIDNSLLLLYFNFGRYLLASSSISGELPANLQGKWNNSINPPWNCDYHFDINIQMCYWMAENANMHECTEALLKYIERFVPHGKRAAMDLYGCRGIYIPMQSDAWGCATPESFGWGAWIGTAPWIAQHFWWHYEYSGDVGFLKERAYPFFKEVARFFEDYLLEDENGVMQIMPSQSPENRFAGTGMFPVSIGISSAVDVQLVYDALGYAITSAKILNIDKDDIQIWENIRGKLPPFMIGRDGRLLEWDIEREEVEPGHRHLSHLYGLYPSNIFNPIERPEQFNASIKSLEYRLAQGGGHTGWSRAWVACLYARIGYNEKVLEHLNALIKDFSTISLLDLHPPRIFQIDGNLGAVAAVTESIAQYWAGKLHLLRALPKEWESGSLYGLKVPGGHTVNMKWHKGAVSELEIVLGYSKEIIISIEGKNDLIIKGEKGMKFYENISET